MPLKNGRTSASLQQILVGSVIPPGTIQAFGGGTVPSGWLLCDGSTASRSTYSALFAAVGTAHGSGDGSTTFHLPDLRGRFLRGADNMGTGAASRDPGGRTTSNAGGNADGLGSVQADAMQGHRHSLYASSSTNAGGLPESPYNGSINGTLYAADTTHNPVTDGTNGSPRTASETRPTNSASLFIIKV